MILNRRKLIGGIGLVFAAPAIVKASSLMKVRVVPLTFEFVWNPGGISYIRNGAILADGSLRFGEEFAGQYREWIAPPIVHVSATSKKFITVTRLALFPTAAGDSAA